jgi:4-oxalocrotonate tautomerase
MPVVHVNVWKGFGEDRVKKLIQKITQVFVEVGVPQQAVEIIVHEIPKTHWGIGGEPASEKFKDILPSNA